MGTGNYLKIMIVIVEVISNNKISKTRAQFMKNWLIAKFIILRTQLKPTLLQNNMKNITIKSRTILMASFTAMIQFKCKGTTHKRIMLQVKSMNIPLGTNTQRALRIPE